MGLDACISLSLGRPPCFSAAHIDAKLPEVAEGPTSREGHEEQICQCKRSSPSPR